MRWLLSLTLLLSVPAVAQDSGTALETRWMRDSVEYWTLTQQTFAVATRSVQEQAKALPKKSTWAVVLDVDETLLDNSTFQLEGQAYGRPFDWNDWNAWTERRAAQAIPGAVDFVTAVREAGGRVVFLTNRHEVTRDATRDNLASEGFWQDGDLLCLKTIDKAYDKRVRRTEVRTGEGRCAWEGEAVTVLAYVGDTMHDFPEDGEDGQRAEAFGQRFFILPNPMYGSWSREVTRESIKPRPLEEGI